MKPQLMFKRKHFVRDCVVAILIILLPFLIYVNNFFPKRTKIYETSFFTLSSNYYQDIQVFVWITSVHLVFVLSYAFWFVTCKHWWRYALLIPLVFFINLLVDVVGDDFSFAHKYEFFLSLVISVPIIFLLLIISKRLSYYSSAKNLSEELDAEINELLIDASDFKVKDYKSLTEKLTTLKKEKHTIDKDTYLTKLIGLREELLSLYS